MKVLLILYALLITLVNGDDGSIDFEIINNDGGLPWSNRANAVLYCHPLNFTYYDAPNRSAYALPMSLIMFGGDDGGITDAYNDVWLMTKNDTQIYNYNLIAGITNTSSAPAPYDKRSFRPRTSSIIAVITPPYDTTINFTSVVISFEDGGRDPEVYVSRDPVTWDSMQLYDPPPPLLHPALVIDSAFSMWMTGGQRPSTAGQHAVNEVWSSKDGGHQWTLMTIAPFSPRFSHSMVKMTGNATSAVDNADVLVLAGGTDGITHFNDVWASAGDSHSQWIRITATAAFSPRRDFSLLLLPHTSVLLLLGGHDTSQTFDSMFASFNGGYTWQEYGTGRKPSFTARHSMMATLDVDGHLMLGGGRNRQGVYLSELYRTRQVIDDIVLLATAFNADLSDCGVGLYCFDSTTTFIQGSRVFCSACVPKEIPIALLIGISVGVAAAIGCFIIYRNCHKRCRRRDDEVLKEIEQRETNADAWSEHLVNEDEYDE